MPKCPAMEMADVNAQHLRRAGKGLLSLALMDARNRTLRWLAMFEDAPPDRLAVAPSAGVEPPVWRFGHIAWFQERWIARNVHRQRGAEADPTAPRLASILPGADAWYDPALCPRGMDAPPGLPGFAFTDGRKSFHRVGEPPRDCATFDAPQMFPLRVDPGDLLLYALRLYHGAAAQPSGRRRACAVLLRPTSPALEVPWAQPESSRRFLAALPERYAPFARNYIGIDYAWRRST